MQGHPWDSAVLKQWVASIATPSLHAAHMGLAGLHNMGTEFIWQMLNEGLAGPCQGARWHHQGLSRAHRNEGGVLQELQLYLQAERQGVPGEP